MRINPLRSSKIENAATSLAVQPVTRYSGQALLRRRSTGSRKDDLAVKQEQSLELANMSVARFSKVNAVSPFVEKTFDLVSVIRVSPQNNKNKDLVRWSESGDSLIITDINTFSDQILPEYFNHNNYSSFIRQLNMYGFRKENKEKKDRKSVV